jgi:hypothetical protein
MSKIPHASYLSIINNSTDIEEKTQSSKYYRDLCLQESDWTQFNDSPLSEEKKQQWAIYRQALRDIPQQSEYPENIIFPVEPQ